MTALERSTVFVGAVSGRESIVRTTVHFDAYSIEEVVQKLRARLKSVDMEGGTNYARDYPPAKLRAIVKASLKRIHEDRELVTETNLQHLFRAMGNIARPVAKSVRITLKPNVLGTISTRSMSRRSAALGSFSKEATVFFDSESQEFGDDSDNNALAEIIDEDSIYPKRASRRVANKYYFKSPVNVVLGTHEPERSFIAKLFEPGIAEELDSWVKSPDTGFYEIGYSWRKGDHTKQGKFNPDLFLKLVDGKDLLVVELKDDGDESDENKAKLKFATEHLQRINDRQKEAVYHIKFLSPVAYDGFFSALRDGSVLTYVFGLQATLGE